MDDLISRQAAIDAIHEDADWLAAQGSDWQMERMERDKSILRSLPSAQSLDPCETCLHKGKGWDEVPCDGCTGTESKYEPERKRGKWLHDKDDTLLSGYCSRCGWESIIMETDVADMPYCPNCGADMRGEAG